MLKKSNFNKKKIISLNLDFNTIHNTSLTLDLITFNDSNLIFKHALFPNCILKKLNQATASAELRFNEEIYTYVKANNLNFIRVPKSNLLITTNDEAFLIQEVLPIMDDKCTEEFKHKCDELLFEYLKDKQSPSSLNTQSKIKQGFLLLQNTAYWDVTFPNFPNFCGDQLGIIDFDTNRCPTKADPIPLVCFAEYFPIPELIPESIKDHPRVKKAIKQLEKRFEISGLSLPKSVDLIDTSKVQLSEELIDLQQELIKQLQDMPKAKTLFHCHARQLEVPIYKSGPGLSIKKDTLDNYKNKLDSVCKSLKQLGLIKDFLNLQFSPEEYQQLLANEDEMIADYLVLYI